MVLSAQGHNDEAEAAYRRAMELAAEGQSPEFARRTRLGLAYHKIKRGDYAEAERLAREVYDELEGSAENKLRAVALHNIGEAKYFQARDAEAMEYFTDSIRLKDEIGDRRGLSLSVYMYALSALREGFPAQAVALMAKSLEIRAEIGIETLPMPKPDHDAAVQRMMAELGPEGFTSAWSRGRELYDEEAVQTITSGL
jgi:tetratricopeptide (TPR) repeat protein